MLDKIEDALKKAGLTREWDKYPTQALQMAKLYYDRESLRARNLFDTPGEPQHDFPADPPPEALRARMPDGSWNDLSDPAMGMAGSRFGRNFPLDGLEAEQPPRLFTPSPRVVARELLQRDVFKPATTLNTLAAAWIQFENHNWFFHGNGDPDKVIDIPLGAGDTFPQNLMQPLQIHLQEVRRLHRLDLAAGWGQVPLPGALERKYTSASREWIWQWVFPQVTRRSESRHR